MKQKISGSRKRTPKVWNRDARIKQAIRKVWSFSPSRRAALKGAQTSPHEWKCNACGRTTEKAYVDHVEAVGLAKDWNEFIHKMFEQSLQVMCRQCHAEKTKQDLKEMKNDSKYKSSKRPSSV